jgi:hypothetical protein
MVRRLFTTVLVLLFSLAFASCGIVRIEFPVLGTPSDDDLVNTAAAQTVSALGTEIATGRTGTVTVPVIVVKTSTVTLTPKPKPAGTDTPGPDCNRAAFIRDVTIPDGSTILPNSDFTKTWELKNTGTCTWNKNYSVIFANKGQAFSGAASTQLMKDGEVKPGESVIATVSLRAPGEPGDYESYWNLRAADNQVFGTGPSGAIPFFVKFHVAEEYSFAEHLCSAQWSSGAGGVPCPGKDGDSQGYVLPVQNPTMEDNQQRDGLGWLSVAQPVSNGFLVGRYPAVMVPPHSDFRATLSCNLGTTGCYVRFMITYQVDNGPEQVLGEWNEGYEGGVTEVVKDLDMVGGRSTSFNFYLYVNGALDQGKGVWFFPRIIKN